MFSWPTNYDSCYTISGSISREGIGLHSGEKTKVKISPYEKEGYYISFSEKPGEIFKLTQDLIGSTFFVLLSNWMEETYILLSIYYPHWQVVD